MEHRRTGSSVRIGLLVLALLTAGRIVYLASRDPAAASKPPASGGAPKTPVAHPLSTRLGGSLKGATTDASQKPSIVLVLTDDQRWDMLDHMPIVHRLLMDHGVTFKNAFVTNSFCCPSRTTILTGKYSHSTGVYNVDPPYGGFVSFDDSSTIATWLQAAGYKTALIGKYLNGYTGTYIPPGWDRWFGLQMNDPGRYYHIAVNDQGTIRQYGSAPSDYSTRVYSAQAASFIRNTAGPLFLYVAPYAPHGPAIPDPVDVSAFPNMKPTRPPNYDEANVSDKPSWVRALPRISIEKMLQTDALRVNRYRSLLAVDRMVGRIVRALAATGRLHNTLFAFMSDNGLSWGEHRWVNRKEAAYEESIRVPLIVRYDPVVHSPRTDGHLVLNLDLAETFADVGGVSAPGSEGRSLLPLLRSSSIPWRHQFLIEHLLYPEVSQDPPTYCGIRTTRFKYILYQTKEQELYNLRKDPYELQNLAHDPRYDAIRRSLRTRLNGLCRPRPPGFTAFG